MPPNSETLLCRYHYDPLDRLVDTTPLKQDALQRFYCKSRLATEIQGQVRRSIFQQEDQLLAQQEHQGDTVLLATDPQRSVLHTVSAHQQRPIVYTPYGHRPVESALLSLLGFNGERPDQFTGHYLLGNGYRALNPVLMRFNSPDSLSPFGKGGLNPYAYCLGDPVNNGDPTGHSVSPFTLLAMGSKWLGRARRNLNLPVGGEVIHTYTVKSPGLLSILGADSAKASTASSKVLKSSSTIYSGNPDVAYHNYSSGISRTRINAPTHYEKEFNRISGTQLETIFNTQQPPDLYRGLNTIESNSSEININNYLSTPRHSSTAGNIKPEAHFTRINTALEGGVPGVIPSRVYQYIVRQGTEGPSGHIPEWVQQYRDRYPWLF